MMKAEESYTYSQKNRVPVAPQVIGLLIVTCGLFLLPRLFDFLGRSKPVEEMDEIDRIRHDSWVLLLDPDSLLSMQAILRCLLFGTLLARSETSTIAMGKRLFMGVCLFMMTYVVRLGIEIHEVDFQAQGPLGGAFEVFFECTACLLLLRNLAVPELMRWRGQKPRTTRVGEALVFLASFGLMACVYLFAKDHYITVDGHQNDKANALYAFVCYGEAFAVFALLLGVISEPAGTADETAENESLCASCTIPFRLSRPRVATLLILCAIQQAFGFYYYLDSFDYSWHSTLDTASGIAMELCGMNKNGTTPQHVLTFSTIEGRGSKEAVVFFMIFSQTLQFGIPLLMIFWRFCWFTAKQVVDAVPHAIEMVTVGNTVNSPRRGLLGSQKSPRYDAIQV